MEGPTKIPKLNSNGSRSMAQKMKLSFARANSVGFDWCRVDQVELLAALTSALTSGAAIMFSQASGGKGVCLKVFEGDGKAVEYAGVPAELNTLLEQVTECYRSTSEDVRENIRAGLRIRESMAAD